MDLFIKIILSIAGGIIPALIWLFFWLKEDRNHPEPNRLLLNTFLFGMLAVPVALVGQFLINEVLIGDNKIQYVFKIDYWLAITTIVVWAGIEEVVKYIAAWKGGISQKANNEPIDAAIYLITAALGFAALENILFLISPILTGDTTAAFITGNMRFIGATLLHVVASGIIGIFMAFSYYKNNELKHRYLITGFFLSITLHTVFNSFIIRSSKFTLIGFAIVWIIAVATILVLEKVKHIIKRRQTRRKKTS